MKIHEFARKRPHLFWYAKNLHKLSEEAIVEGVLNYGGWDDVQELIAILGLAKTAKIFRTKTNLKRCNFKPQIKNYFKLYFNKYA